MKIRYLDTGIHVLRGLPGVWCGRAFTGKKTNLELVRKWLGVCRKAHSAALYDRYTVLEPPRVLRLIDVHTNGFILAPIDVDSVALSCVWGSIPQYRTLKDNRLRHETVGLPMGTLGVAKPIQDSTTLTRELGFAYLWVDAICIVQDDEGKMEDQIQAMGWIYSK